MSIQIASDNFTRANGDLGANWTALDAGLQIVSNTARTTITGGSANSVWSANTWPNDQYSEITAGAQVIDDTDFIVPTVRASGSAAAATLNCYLGVSLVALGSSGSLGIYRRIGNVQTALVTTTATVNIGDIIRISAVGTTITLYLNGVQQVQTTDSSVASGSPGMLIYVGSGSFANSIVNSWAGGIFTIPQRTLVGTGV